MHIPDGFLDTKTVVASAVLSAAGVATAYRHTRRYLPARRVPLLGLSAAFVFAAQMLNFPVAGGTSGHLMGAVLTAVLLGPAAAVIVITSVLLVQCFVFADGGMLALGANVFNMAIIGSLTGYAVYRSIARISAGETWNIVAVAVASWLSVVLASICCAGELAWSGTVSWQTAFPAMAGVHALIGVGEAVITSLVVVAVRRARPELLRDGQGHAQQGRYGTLLVYGGVISLGLVLFVSPFASRWPDGLEKVAASLGFDRRALQESTALMPDYRFPLVGDSTAATILAGIAGVFLILILSFVLTKLVTTRHQP